MNYYEIGKSDGKSQFELDILTETDRQGELLVSTAMYSIGEKFSGLSDVSQTKYACGFVEGYLVAQFSRSGDRRYEPSSGIAGGYGGVNLY